MGGYTAHCLPLVLTTFRVRETRPLLPYPTVTHSPRSEKRQQGTPLVLLPAAVAQEVKLPGPTHRPAS